MTTAETTVWQTGSATSLTAELPLPTHLPTVRDPEAPTGPVTCPLHGQSSPYTRNTRGEYSSHAPACCGPDGGCNIGRQEELESLIASQLTEMTDTLANHLVTDPSISYETTFRFLVSGINDRIQYLQRTTRSFQTQIQKANNMLSLLLVLENLQYLLQDEPLPLLLEEALQEVILFEEDANLDEPTNIRRQVEDWLEAQTPVTG